MLRREDGGGWPGSNRAYRFHKKSEDWTELPNMLSGRTAHNCGVAKAMTGKEVVVAGGYRYGSPLNSVEIFSIEDNMWRSGNSNSRKMM